MERSRRDRRVAIGRSDDIFVKCEAHPQSDYVLHVFYSLDMMTTLVFSPHAMYVLACTFCVGVEAAGILTLALCGIEEERNACMLRIMLDAVPTKMATQYTRSTRNCRILAAIMLQLYEDTRSVKLD